MKTYLQTHLTTLKSHLSLLLCLAAITPALAQQHPTELLAKTAFPSYQTLERNPILKRQYDQWQSAQQQALIQQLRTLAQKGDANSLLTATLLYHGFQSNNPTNNQQTAEVDRWFNAARNIRPRHPLTAWTEILNCPLPPSQCRPQPALEFLRQTEPNNAAVHLLQLEQAIKQKDENAITTHLRRAATSSYYNPHILEISQQLYQTAHSFTLPPIPPTLLTEIQPHTGMDQTAIDREQKDLYLIGAQLSIHQFPPFTPLLELCKDPKRTSLQPDCVRVFALMADDHTNILVPMIGLTQIVRLTADSPSGPHWREQLRQMYWLLENMRTLQQQSTNIPPTQRTSLSEYNQWLMTQGELSANQHTLQRFNIPTTPPTTWMPANIRQRIQVTTGKEP